MKNCSPDGELYCAYCGNGPLVRGQISKRKPRLHLRASVDHFEPKHLSHIDSGNMANFVVSCIECNNEKEGLEGENLVEWVRTKCAKRRNLKEMENAED